MSQDVVKQVIGRYWAEQAATFDDQLFHSIATEAEQRAWDRILDLLTRPGRILDVLDVGCGTGFLALLFAARGHRVVGVDLAPEMIARAQQKAQERGLPITFSVDDAEALSLPDAAYDLVVSRHLFWTLPHPERALAEWVRVTRPGGRIAIIDGQWNLTTVDQQQGGGTQEGYDEAVAAALPYYGGAPADQVAALLRAQGLQNVQIDNLEDLVAAQRARLTEEEWAKRNYRRYVVFGDRPRSAAASE